MKLKFSALFFLLALSQVFGQNLIQDSDCESDPLTEEFGLSGAPDQSRLLPFTEDLTWNKCLKFELLKYQTDKNGKRFVNTFVRIGGTRRIFGFPCKPETTYRFSVEIRGDAPRAIFNFCQWTDSADNWRGYTMKRTGIHTFTPQKEWTRYQGTFRTGPDAKRAALAIGFWGSEAANDMPDRVGQYILIDRIRIEEVKEGAITAAGPGRSSGIGENLPEGIRPASVCIVSETPAKLNGFRDLKADKPARLPSEGEIRMDRDSLYFDLHFKGAKPEIAPDDSLWANDAAEIFFAPVKSDRRLSQFVIAADGRRWQGNGSAEVKRYDEWKASVSTGEDGWRVQAEIPFRLLGYDAAPADGSFLAFNVGRQHIDPVRCPDKPDFSRGNRWAYGRMYDHSSWSFGYGDESKFGILFFGTMEPYIEAELKEIVSPELSSIKEKIDRNSPGLAWNQLKKLREEDRMLKLSKEPFIAARISPSADPAVPFMPEALNQPQERYRIRAAVNEHAPLVLALANMTADFEEYRVTLSCGWERAEPQVEYWYPQAELKSPAGVPFPKNRITIRRGVQGRDSDAEIHGKRFDILTRIDGAAPVPVPSRQSGLIWIDFDCHGVEPGIYHGTLDITPLSSGRFLGYKHVPGGLQVRDTLTKRIPLELEVLPIELFDDDLPLNGFRTGIYQYHFDFMKQYNTCMYMVTPWYFCVEFGRDGSLVREKFRSFLEPHIRLIAKNAGTMPANAKKVMVAYGTYDNFKNVHWPKKEIAFDTPEYWNAWRNWCRAMDDVLVRNGIGRKDYTVEIADEPQLKKFSVEELTRACRELKDAVPGVHITVTNASDVYGREMGPLVDSWIFSQYEIYDRKRNRNIAWFRSLPGKDWSVYCCETRLSMDLYRYYRIHPWKAFDLRAGFVSIYQFLEQQPGTDFYRVPAGGLAYDTSAELVPSIRLENLRIGMTDVKYLKLLERLAAGDSEAAREARKFLEKAPKEVVVTYPHVDSKADEMRSRAIDLILKLQRQDPAR